MRWGRQRVREQFRFGATTTSGAAPAGEPIKVMVEAPVDSQVLPFPNIPETARIYQEYINAKGGINGRPLEVIPCDDRADAGEAANCARKAVSEKVIANVGSFTLDVSQGIPIYEENDISWFGACCPVQAQEYNSPISFPLGYTNAFPTAGAIRMVDDGCKSLAFVIGDDPSSEIAVARVRERAEIDRQGGRRVQHGEGEPHPR